LSDGETEPEFLSVDIAIDGNQGLKFFKTVGGFHVADIAGMP